MLLFSSYWFVLVRPATLNESDGGFQPLLEEDAEESTQVTNPEEAPVGEVCCGAKQALIKLASGVKVRGHIFLFNTILLKLCLYKNVKSKEHRICSL